ncbi:MAG TPA: ATP-binding protein [archaeon]|nr:ATP-binding protein [archaeon]
MQEIIYEMNPWWEAEYKFIGIKREKYLNILTKNLNNKDIIFLTGLRRIGKSTILKQLIYLLINEQKINPKEICYLSLDNYSFKEYTITELVRQFRKINNLKINDKIYLFLDEITYKDSFKEELKNLYDLEHTKIFATASSANKLVDKKALLTGRARTIEVNPLDFQEFLIFKNYKPKNSEKYLLENYFKKYMELGGIPEYVITEDPTYVTNLTENILYKDIIAANNIKNSENVKDLFRLLCERVGKPLSNNKLANIIGINKNTVKKYIGFFKETYLFYVIEKDAKTLNQRIADNKKIYCADVGIKNVSTGFKDLGAIYENLVFLKIKTEQPRFIYENSIEIDFKFKDTIIEAKYNQEMNDKQKELFSKIKVKNKIIANGVDFFS